MKTEKKLLPLILAAWTLIKAVTLFVNFLSLLGFLVVLFFRLLLNLTGTLLRTLLHLTSLVLAKKHRGRGRPRSRPFKEYLLYKIRPILLFLKRIFPKPVRIGLASLIVLGVVFYYSSMLIQIANELPSPERLSDINGALTTIFYDRNGNILYRLFEDKNRYLVKLDDIPPQLQQATIAIEDKNFYSHSGVDFEGVTRAILTYFQKDQADLQGGSTITQQLIKNTLLSPERTLKRKFKEIILAFWAERVFSKQAILQMYFNEVAYGGTSWGISAASQTYFGKQPKDLDLAQSSYLAGLPASPTTYSPYGANPELGKMRQKEVLRRMVEDGYITQDQAVQAYEKQLEIKPQFAQIKAPHFVMYVKKLLADKYGEKMVGQGGLKVYTSLDMGTQEMAEKVVEQEVGKLNNLNITNGAAVIMDPKNGQILAMVGSRNYWDQGFGSFNVATALRQPGSSIKPITYATGFKMGYSPASVILDAPIVFKNQWEVYAPVNYDGAFHGPVTIRTALGSSYNIPAVKMLAAVGIPNMIQTAKDLGITSFNDPDRYGLSLTLGGGEVKLLDMMTVYSTFSQMGLRHDPQPILKVVDPSGNPLEDNQTKFDGNRVLPTSVAFLITDILADNKAREPVFGPNSLLKIPGHTVAVKTGTTDSKKDNWTFGYTPEVAVGVWVGNNNGDPMDPRLSSGITGAAPIWNQLMTKLLDGKKDLAFQRPPDVVEGMVEGKKDLVIAGQTKGTLLSGENKSLIGQKEEKKKTPTPKDLTFTDPFTTIITPGANP